jgi:hypothetical protein
MDRIHSAAAAAVAVAVIVMLSTLSFMSVHTVFADSYKKTQSASSQTNECGNYWFPINVLCSNINSQTQGDENSVGVTSAQEDGNVESTKNFGAPFP